MVNNPPSLFKEVVNGIISSFYNLLFGTYQQKQTINHTSLLNIFELKSKLLFTYHILDTACHIFPIPPGSLIPGIIFRIFYSLYHDGPHPDLHIVRIWLIPFFRNFDNRWAYYWLLCMCEGGGGGVLAIVVAISERTANFCVWKPIPKDKNP